MSKQAFPMKNPSNFGFSKDHTKELVNRVLDGVAKMQQDRGKDKDPANSPGMAPRAKVF